MTDEERLATWRGRIEARVEMLEREMSNLAKTTAGIDRTVTKMDGRMDRLQDGQEECRKEIAAAVAQIESGKNNAVAELKQTIAAHEAANLVLSQGRETRRLTKFQLLLGGVISFAIAMIPTLLTLAVAGQLK